MTTSSTLYKIQGKLLALFPYTLTKYLPCRENFKMEGFVKNQPTTLKFKLLDSFNLSLDHYSTRHQYYMDKILNFLQVLMKKALTDKKYKQVGRLPRFFNIEESVSIE
jgi:hypothetical protein